MIGYSRDVGSSSSTSTGISLGARTAHIKDVNSGEPRKRTWGGGLINTTRPSVGLSPSHGTGARPHLGLETSLELLSLDNAPHLQYESDCQQLRDCIQKLKSVPADLNYVDAACKEYNSIKDKTKALCYALLRQPQDERLSTGPSPVGNRPNLSLAVLSDTSSLSSQTRASPAPGSSGWGYRSPYIYEQHLDLLRTWIACLEALLSATRNLLVGTYKEWEPDASPAMVEQLLQNTKFRKHVISRIRTASKTKTVSGDVDFFPRYSLRLGDHDQLKLDVTEMRRLLQDNESGISPDRVVEEITISQRGDAVLEFANGTTDEFPVLRFRVSSYMLSETSPIFAQMFNSSAISPALDDCAAHDLPCVLSRLTCSDGDIADDLPPAATRYTSWDGTEVNRFRMPQLELNIGHSFEILLHAAHIHNDRIPREIEFSTFIAVAEVCMRYQCTAPLELSVEYLWLPQWMHKATEYMPGGLLLISYAFGLRRLFTRMSKTAILNVEEKEDLGSLPWPEKIKDKIWAIRTAKMGQVYQCCNSILQEYLRCPPSSPSAVRDVENAGLVPTVKPRCSKGSHSCDAVCLGWLMMLFNELQVLPQIMLNANVGRRPPPPKRSLNQLLDNLRFMSSPPNIHIGPCDFASAFRADINDIYNSVSGLTLFDVSGKHGWALSRHKSLLPQPVLKLGGLLPDLDAAKRTIDDVSLRILREIDSLEDVYNIALVNRAFFEVFKSNEVVLLRGLIHKAKNKAPRRWTLNGAATKTDARAELEHLREESIAKIEQTEPTGVASAKRRTEPARTVLGASNRPSDNESVSEHESDSNGRHDNFASKSSIEAINVEHGEKMTREEAERILWPNDVVSDTSCANAAARPEYRNDHATRSIADEAGPTEKFRAGDLVLGCTEEKSLLAKEDKNLSNEHYERIGLVRPMQWERTEIMSDRI